MRGARGEVCKEPMTAGPLQKGRGVASNKSWGLAAVGSLALLAPMAFNDAVVMSGMSAF